MHSSQLLSPGFASFLHFSVERSLVTAALASLPPTARRNWLMVASAFGLERNSRTRADVSPFSSSLSASASKILLTSSAAESGTDCTRAARLGSEGRARWREEEVGGGRGRGGAPSASAVPPVGRRSFLSSSSPPPLRRCCSCSIVISRCIPSFRALETSVLSLSRARALSTENQKACELRTLRRWSFVSSVDRFVLGVG